MKLIGEVAFSGAHLSFFVLFVFPKAIVKIGGIQFGDSYSWWVPGDYDSITDMPVSEKRFDFPDSLKCYYSRRTYGYSSFSVSIKDIFKSDTVTVGEKWAQVRKSVDRPPGMLTEDHHHTVHGERQVCDSSHLRPKPLHL